MGESPIKKSIIRSLKLSGNVVTDISVATSISEDEYGLVDGQTVDTKLKDLSASIVENYANNIDTGSPALFKSLHVKDIFSFDPDYLSGSIAILGSSETRNVVSAAGIPAAAQNPSGSGRIDTPTEANYSQYEKLLTNYSGYVTGTDYTKSKYFRIPSIVRTNTGRLISVFDIRWQSVLDISWTPANDQATGISYSDDDGVTWSQPKIAIDWLYPDYDESNPSGMHYQSGVSDPGVLYDEDHGVVMIFSIGGRGYNRLMSQLSSSEYSISSFTRQQLVFAWSKDDGETWSKPQAVSDKIYDNAELTSQNWAKTYKYLFSTCSPGIQLRRQPNVDDNGTMLFSVQICELTPLAENAGGSRSTILVVKPEYDADNNIVDMKMHFLGGLTSDSVIGAHCGGSSEGQLCEGPNGELAYIVKAYSGLTTPTGSASNNVIYSRIYKSTDLGQTWEAIGDYENPSDPLDKVCTTLETVAATKPAIGYFPSLSCYAVAYCSATLAAPSVRNYSIIRYSTDLVNWKMLYQIEAAINSGYPSFMQQNLKPNKIEGIFEANADGFNDRYLIDPLGNDANGAAKQLKFYSFDFKHGECMTKRSNRHVELGYLEGSNNYYDAIAFRPEIFTTKDTVTITSISIQANKITSTNANMWCVIFDGNEPTSLPLARSGTPISTTNCIYTFKFLSKVVLHKGTTYCVRFRSVSTTPASDDNIPSTREEIFDANNMNFKIFGSKTATDPNKCILVYRRSGAGTTASPYVMTIQTTTISGNTCYLQPIMSINLD